MNKYNLRRKKPSSYFEPDEPAFDEYEYCDKCADFVFEYCSIHGPLLVIPDDQIPVNSMFPSYVPRAALTIPNMFLHIAPSIIPGAGLGVFTTLTLPRGVRFGPYRGQTSKEITSVYCWQIYDGNNKRSHLVDAMDANKSNWMRYVNCSRHWREQNLVAYQYQGELYYRTIKIIPRFTELLVFYGSEFANTLNIDLRLYNSKEHHLIIGQKFKLLEEETIKADDQKCDTIVSDIIDDFQYIDENTEFEETLNKFNRNFKHDSKSLTSVRYDNDNQSFKVEIQNTLKTNEQENKSEKDKKFICNHCDYKCNHRFNLKRHAVALHPDAHPNFETHSIGNINRLRNTHKIQNYKCQRCKNIFPTKSLFDEHKDICRNTKYKCSVCYYDTTRSYQLREHMQRHTKELIFKCDKCPYFCYVKKDLLKHRRLIHHEYVINTSGKN